jgi:uncharacterized membrane protein YvbJ
MDITTIAIIATIFGSVKAAFDIRLAMLNIKKTETRKSVSKWRRVPIADIFSWVSLIIVSYKLWGEYSSNDPVTRTIVLNIALLFSLAVFNILSLVISNVERRLRRWVDNFLTALEQLLGLIQDVDTNSKLRDQR